MEELPIGAEVVLKVVENTSCNGCFFDEIASSIKANYCERIKCTNAERKDKKNVQFKRVK